MNTCPNCGKIVGLHSSILQGCMCQYSMQAPPKKEWVGLTNEEFAEILCSELQHRPELMLLQVQAKLREKNG